MPSRRNLLATTVAAAAATALSPAPAQAQTRPRTFVLVHGAWHGGWCWSRVADILTAHGHRVFAPSLTGLADRSHLLSTTITLDTHIADIVNLFKWEDLHDVVLVAHSYGGWPVSGALEKVLAQVSSVVFVDAFMPESGQRGLDLSSEQFQAALREAVARGEAGRPVPPASAFRLRDPRDAAWVTERMTPQPVGVAMQAIQLSGAREKVARKTYIRAPAYPQPSFDSYLAHCKATPGWKTFVFSPEESGHDVMVDAPVRLAAILEEVA